MWVLREYQLQCVEVKKQINQRIHDNRRIGTNKTASEISISKGKK
jgi:hypothetical protein